MTEQVKQKAAAIDNELGTLPEPPEGNLPMLILQSLNDLETSFKKIIDGDISTLIDREVPGSFFWKDWNSLATTFRGVMEESRPVLMMGHPTDPVGVPTPIQQRYIETIDLDEEHSDMRVASQTGQKRRRISDGPNTTSSDKRFAARFTLRQLRDIIQEGVPGLPGQIDTRTVDRVINLSLQKWVKPLDQFLRRVEQLCCDMFMKHVNQIFGHWRGTGLYTEVAEICNSFLKDAMDSQRHAARRALQLELQRPMSFNAEGLKIAEEKALRQIEVDRHNYRAALYLNQQGQKNSKGSGGLSREDKVARVSDTQLGSDPYSQEVHLMGVSHFRATNC